MKIDFIIINMITLFGVVLLADNGNWGEKNIIEKNSVFEKMKIKNRSKKIYKDKIYKYITGNYKVKNNNIELANIYLDDKLKDNDVKINILTENLKVESNPYRDSMDIKRNNYKHFVQHDEKGISFFSENNKNQQVQENANKYNNLGNNIQSTDSRYNKVSDEDISELETIDLRGKDKIKDVNVYIKDVNIWVP